MAVSSVTVRAGAVPLRRAWGRGLVQPAAEVALETLHRYPGAYGEVMKEMGVRLSSVVCSGRIRHNRHKQSSLKFQLFYQPKTFQNLYAVSTDLKTSMLCPCLTVS